MSPPTIDIKLGSLVRSHNNDLGIGKVIETSDINAIRTAYFQHRVLTDARLDGIANIFQRDWLYQIYLSMLTARALADQIPLESAFNALKFEDIGQEMARVLENIFQTLNVEETLLEEGEESAPEPSQGRQRVHDLLLAFCTDWREQVEDAFKRGSSVSLIARPAARGDLKLAILDLADEPVDIGFLHVYPQVERFQRHPRGFAVRLRVREAVQ